MSNKHADKEGGKGVYTHQSNLGGKDTSKDQVGGQKKSNSQQHDDNQSDSLDYQQGEKSKNIKPNRQKGEDNKKRAGGNPQPTQPTTTDTQSIGSSPKPTAAKPQETPTDTQTTGTSPKPTAAKSQQTAADTQTEVSSQPSAAKSQQTATDTQTIVVSSKPTAAKPQETPTDTQTTVVSPQPTAAKSQQTATDTQTTTDDTQPIGTSPQLTAADTQTVGVNPKPISDNLQQAGDNPQHKDLSDTESEDMEEEGQPTMTRTKISPKANTTVRRKAKSPNVQEYRDSRFDFSDDEQYDMTEANRIEKSKSRTGMDEWTNQLWIPIINIATVISCVLFTIIYTQYGQVTPVSPTDNSNVQKQLRAMERDNRALRNEMKTCQTMLDDIPSKLGASEGSVTDKIREVEKVSKQ